MAEKQYRLAVIDEARCIGCALCLEACPVDAIIGSRKYLHTVFQEACIGCMLCVPACPVECIDFIFVDTQPYDKEAVKRRYHARKLRHATAEEERVARQKALSKEAKKAYIQAITCKEMSVPKFEK